MKSNATTVKDYLAGLPEDRRPVVALLRNLVAKHVPAGYQEVMGYGMITWSVPLKIYPDTYNKQPLIYAALGSQKNYVVLHVMSRIQMVREGYEKAGKKLDAGGGCIRFRKQDDVLPDVIARAIASVPMKKYVEFAQQMYSKEARAERTATRKKAAKKPAPKKTASKKAAPKKPIPKKAARKKA
jgi:hypothetical protein